MTGSTPKGSEVDGNNNSDWFRVLFSLIVGLFLVCENGLLLVVICKNKNYTNNYHFVASLGATDTIVGVNLLMAFAFSLPPVTSHLLASSIGITGINILGTILVTLSILHMPIIAADRYVYIAYPFFYEKHFTPRAIRGIIAMIWLLSFAFLISLVLVQIYEVGEYIEKLAMLPQPLTLILILIYGSMNVVTCAFYVLIVLHVRKHTRTISCLTRGAKNPNWREKAKSVKFFFMVFGVYLIMTCPIFIIITLEGIYLDRYGVIIAVVMAALGSGVNAILLNIVDKKFRCMTQRTLCPSTCGCYASSAPSV